MCTMWNETIQGHQVPAGPDKDAEERQTETTRDTSNREGHRVEPNFAYGGVG